MTFSDCVTCFGYIKHGLEIFFFMDVCSVVANPENDGQALI